jgi:phenylalanyl-tRNA synthetase beta chain
VRREARRSAHALRHALAGLDYQETINFSFVEARWEHDLAGNADPIRVLNPIAAPLAVMRSSLMGSLVACCATTWRARRRGCGCSTGPRVHARRQRAATATRRGRCAPAHARGGAGLRPGRCAAVGHGKERAVDFFDVKGDVEALLAPRRRASWPPRAPGAAPGPLRASKSTGAIGHVGELHPKWRQAYELPQAPVLFELDLDAVLERARCPSFQPVPRQQPVLARPGLVVGDAVAHDALMASQRSGRPGPGPWPPRCSTSTSPTSRGRHGRGERSLAVRLELLDDSHADRRAHRQAPWQAPWRACNAGFRRAPARLDEPERRTHGDRRHPRSA